MMRKRTREGRCDGIKKAFFQLSIGVKYFKTKTGKSEETGERLGSCEYRDLCTASLQQEGADAGGGSGGQDSVYKAEEQRAEWQWE